MDMQRPEQLQVSNAITNAAISVVAPSTQDALPRPRAPACEAAIDAPDDDPRPLSSKHDHRPEWPTQGPAAADTEFDRKYPPDAWGEEAAPNARVWKIYRDEQSESDRAMLDTWNKTLDVLLIFAGLFSAVSTAFIIESYKALQPDYAQYIATFLYASAVSQNRTGNVLPPLEAILSPDRFIQTSASQRWTNLLWFSSLVISLAVALLSILVKQWLGEYDAHVSYAAPSLKYWARRHCLYHAGLHSWGVPVLISFLPPLLHLSLFLFLAGLVLFLHPLDTVVTYTIVAMVSSIALFYGLSLILPVWYVECPSYTPLLAQARRGISAGIGALRFVAEAPGKIFQWASSERHRMRGDLEASSFRVSAKRAAARLEPTLTRAKERADTEMRAVDESGLELDGLALSTLLISTTDKDIIAAAFAAIGTVPPERTTTVISLSVPSDILSSNTVFLYPGINSNPTVPIMTTYARRLRAYLVLALHGDRIHIRYMLPNIPDLWYSLGVDGLMLAVMAPSSGYRPDIAVEHLLVSLQCLLAPEIPWETFDNTRSHETCMHPSYLHTVPHRSTCLLLLASLDRLPPGIRALPQFFSCVLLVFCAFLQQHANAEEHELLLALRHVGRQLEEYTSIGPQSYGGEDYPPYEIINRLSFILIDHERHNIDLATAQIVAHYIGFLSTSTAIRSPVPWAALPGLSEFIRSPSFDRCVSSRPNLEGYLVLLQSVPTEDCDQVQRRHLWTCIAIILKMSCRHTLSPTLPRAVTTLMVTHTLLELELPLNDSGPPDNVWYEGALSAFLDGPSAVATWPDAAWVRPGDEDPLIYLAHQLSMALCRKQHFGVPNEAFVQGLFSGSFLFARLRNTLWSEKIPTLPYWRRMALDTAKHCARLSPTAWADIYAQLEAVAVGDEGSEHRTSATAEFLRELSDRCVPMECASDCPCVAEIEETEDTGAERWKDFMALFRRSRPADSHIRV